MINVSNVTSYYKWLFVGLFVVYVPSILPFIPYTIAGLNMTGWSWTVLLLVSIYYWIKNPVNKFPVYYWIPWVLYLVVWLFFDMSYLGIQLTLQYLLPLVVGVVASGFVYNKKIFNLIFKYFLILTAAISFLFVSEFLSLGLRQPHWAATVIFLTVPASLVLGVFYLSKDFKYLILFFAMMLMPVWAMTRMAVVVFLVILVMHFANTKVVMKAVVMVMALFVGLLVVNSAAFQEKTFYKGSGDVSQLTLNYYEDNSQFNTSGRSNFYQYFEKGLRESPILGNGPRSDYAVLESSTGFKEVHNDYLSIIYNYGYFGLAMLMIGLVLTFISVFRRMSYLRAINDGYGYLVATSVLVLFLGLLMFMYTDNIIKYNIFFMNFFFAMIGIVFAEKSYNEE
jgi:hypothetical protein